MTEVIISSNSNINNPWYKFASNTSSKLNEQKELPKKTEVIQKNLIFIVILWIKNKFISKIQEGDKIRPVIPLKVRKNTAYLEIGSSTGIIFSKMNIY